MSESEFGKRSGRELFEVVPEEPGRRVAHRWLTPANIHGLPPREDEFAADRSRLRRVQITTKNGVRRHYWIDPSKQGAADKPTVAAKTDHPDNAAKPTADYHPTAEAEQRVAHALQNPATITREQLAGLFHDFDSIQRDKLRVMARDLEMKVGGRKMDLINRFLDRLKGQTVPSKLDKAAILDELKNDVAGLDVAEVERGPGARGRGPKEGHRGGTPSPVKRSKKLPKAAVEAIPETKPAATKPLDLKTLADKVKDVAAQVGEEGRFGTNKTFINHVWKQLKDDPQFSGLDYDGFKNKLIEANREGLLTLSRADLPQIMDRDNVRDSEINYPPYTTYHFILNDRGGTPPVSSGGKAEKGEPAAKEDIDKGLTTAMRELYDEGMEDPELEEIIPAVKAKLKEKYPPEEVESFVNAKSDRGLLGIRWDGTNSTMNAEGKMIPNPRKPDVAEVERGPGARGREPKERYRGGTPVVEHPKEAKPATNAKSTPHDVIDDIQNKVAENFIANVGDQHKHPDELLAPIVKKIEDATKHFTDKQLMDYVGKQDVLGRKITNRAQAMRAIISRMRGLIGTLQSQNA
jgi:hypothetical protein